MIKAVIFDLGGVILNIDSMLDKFASIFKPKNKAEFWNELNLKVIPLCKNMMSENDFWRQIAESHNTHLRKVPSNLWSMDFEKLAKINKKVMKIITKLRKSYKVAIISNTMASHVRILRKNGLFRHFDATSFSNELGLTKDNKKIFRITARKMDVKPSECIFIDDISEFVSVAKSAGMKGILFKDPNQLKKELKKLLR